MSILTQLIDWSPFHARAGGNLHPVSTHPGRDVLMELGNLTSIAGNREGRTATAWSSVDRQDVLQATRLASVCDTADDSSICLLAGQRKGDSASRLKMLDDLQQHLVGHAFDTALWTRHLCSLRSHRVGFSDLGLLSSDQSLSLIAPLLCLLFLCSLLGDFAVALGLWGLSVNWYNVIRKRVCLLCAP